MDYLKNYKVEYPDPRAVRDLKAKFGMIYFGSCDSGPRMLRLMVFKNCAAYSGYRGTDEDRKLLYVLVPSENIDAVWPDGVGNCARVRYGMAHDVLCPPATPLVSIQLKDGTGLLFCLDPSGKLLREGNSFGV